MAAFTCTGCNLGFDSPDEQRAHFKLDWHRYNLRRKVAGLAPVERADFDRRLAAMTGAKAPAEAYHGQCKQCRKSFSSEGLHRQHLQSKKHKDTLKRLGKADHSPTSRDGPTDMGPATPDASIPAQAEAGGFGLPASAATMVDEEGGAGEDKEVVEEAGEEGEEAARPPPPMGPDVCVFCDLRSPGLEENCAHMLLAHGFFIPDAEYLSDVAGLVKYAEEKVKMGRICLYCNGKRRAFHSCRAVQQHMTDRSHCKLLYEEGQDLHEWEPFYDFSATYEEALQEGLVRPVPSGEGEDATEGGENDEHESGNMDAMEGADGTGGAEEEEEEEQEEYVEFERGLEVSDIGELVLLNGRTIGNRHLRRYYRQHVPAEDTREAVVAQRREQKLCLLDMYRAAGHSPPPSARALAAVAGHPSKRSGLATHGGGGRKDLQGLQAVQRSAARYNLGGA